MKNTLSILFYLRKNKTDKRDKIPVYMRLTVNGERAVFSTGLKIDFNFWDSDAHKMKGTSEEARTFNTHLDNMKSNVNRQFITLESLEKEITADAIKNAISGVSEKKHTLIEIFNYHNDNFKQRVGNDFVYGTYQHYLATLVKVKGFIQYQYRKTDLLLDDLNHQFVTNFELYLKSIEGCCHNTAMKHIKNLKKIIKLALANEWLERDPFISFKCSYNEVHRGYLTMEELEILTEKHFSIKRLEIVRDIFLFSCYTGLAYSDVAALSKDDITTGIDGEKWIIIYRHKTGNRCSFPILPQAMEIIKKYEDFPECENVGKLFPVKSNQKMNAYLKEISDLCGIDKNFSTHLARHTFATTITLANGVPIESVSKMIGHNSIRTTQIYSKVVDSKISKDMKNLMEVLSSKLNNQQVSCG